MILKEIIILMLGEVCDFAGIRCSLRLAYRRLDDTIRFYGLLVRSCITELSLHNDVYFDRNGYYDSSKITFRDKLGNQRIADLLPYAY